MPDIAPVLPSAGAPKDSVDLHSLAYDEMADRWELLHDLQGGTVAMRKAGRRWLPDEKDEQEDSYDRRLSRSFLYAAYKDTVEKLSSKPFIKPVTLLGESLPTGLEEIEDNVDRRGTNLTALARDMMEAGCVYGFTHLLIDYPPVPAGATLEEERRIGARPMFVHIKPPDMIAWQTRMEGTVEVLSMIRFREVRNEIEGKYGEQRVEYIRVITEDTWELWRKAPDDKEFVQISWGGHTFGRIPLRTCYFRRGDAMMTGMPPLEDLAWLNLAHYQSSSEQRNALRFARIGLLFGSGFSDEEIENGVRVAPGSLTASASPTARLAYVEHTGAAMEVGRNDLNDTEEQMEVLGLQPLIQKSGDLTATASAIGESKTHAEIQAWIRNLERCLYGGYEDAAEWVGETLADDFGIDIYSDFILTLKASEDIASLFQMVQGGKITLKTFLTEIQRRGLLSETVDIEQEMEDLKNEGPDLGMMGGIDPTTGLPVDSGGQPIVGKPPTAPPGPPGKPGPVGAAA